MPIYKCCKQ